MPKATVKSKNNSQNPKKSFFDIALDTFKESGHFTLTKQILNSELDYFGEYLEAHSNSSSERSYRFYLNHVTFNVEVPTLFSQKEALDYADEEVLYQLQKVFDCSPKWSVIAFHNVTILQGEHCYSLSPYFIYRLLNLLVAVKDHLSELSITNAEFHPWIWIRFLTLPLMLDMLTLDLLPNEDKDDNLMVLCEALQYAKIKNLNLGDTEISIEGYQALNELLDKNYFIEKMRLKKPTDPASRAIFRKINQRLPESRTGKLRFDIEKFNQAQFLQFIVNAQNALQDETDKTKISKLKSGIKFLLKRKQIFNLTDREDFLNEARDIGSVYPDHAEYIEAYWPLFRLDLSQLVDNETRTVGHLLLENSLEQDDMFMVSTLIDAGANLLEQQEGEKPFLIQVFEKNRDFKLLILKHIFHHQALVIMAERVLGSYPSSKQIMIEVAYSLISYAETLIKRADPSNLSDFERLLSLLKDAARLPRPSKQRDNEFIAIYGSLFKCLILFHDTRRRVTVESISSVQTILNEIIAISLNAEWGWNNGSTLHRGLAQRLRLLWQDMERSKKQVEKDQVIYEKDKVIQEQANTIKDMTEENRNIKKILVEMRKQQVALETELQQFQVEITSLDAELKEKIKRVNELASEENARQSEGETGVGFFSRC